jgi:hypothetical protein
MNHVDKAVDALKKDLNENHLAFEEWMAAQNVLLKALIEQYVLDIRDWELDKKGFCQGQIYRGWLELLGFDWKFGRFSESVIFFKARARPGPARRADE